MNWKDANSTEINPDTPYPVVIDMPVKYITVKSFTYIALLVFFFNIFRSTIKVRWAVLCDWANAQLFFMENPRSVRISNC